MQPSYSHQKLTESSNAGPILSGSKEESPPENCGLWQGQSWRLTPNRTALMPKHFNFNLTAKRSYRKRSGMASRDGRPRFKNGARIRVTGDRNLSSLALALISGSKTNCSCDFARSQPILCANCRSIPASLPTSNRTRTNSSDFVVSRKAKAGASSARRWTSPRARTATVSSSKHCSRQRRAGEFELGAFLESGPF